MLKDTGPLRDISCMADSSYMNGKRQMCTMDVASSRRSRLVEALNTEMTFRVANKPLFNSNSRSAHTAYSY